MARRIRALYEWSGGPEAGSLQQVGEISEARLRAWEYEERDGRWELGGDTVRVWETARVDLCVPGRLLVGDREEVRT